MSLALPQVMEDAVCRGICVHPWDIALAIQRDIITEALVQIVLGSTRVAQIIA
jgi:hypothetical protein